MHCIVVGAGKLGKQIAFNLMTHRIISSVSICNQSLSSTKNVCNELGFGEAFASIATLPPADICFICTPDDQISAVIDQFSKHFPYPQKTYFVHCSGALNSNIFAPLKAFGVPCASFHPLKAFQSQLDSTIFFNLDCVMEGDSAVCNLLENMFNQLGAIITYIKPEDKSIYHAAASIAANYMVSLAAQSEHLLTSIGISKTQSQRMILNLMESNLRNLNKVDHFIDALTGPLARNDLGTLNLHLQCLQNQELILKMYKSIALATLEFTPHNNNQKTELITLLS